MPVREQPWMCVMCGYAMSAYSPMIGEEVRVAEDGDVSMCLNCGMAYARHGPRWEPLTKAERAALDPEARLLLDRARAFRPLVITKDLAAGRGGRA
jgi:hypothetical protein